MAVSGSVISRQLREAGFNPGGAAVQYKREGIFVRQYGRGAEARVTVHIDIDRAGERFGIAHGVRQALREHGYVYREHRDDEYGTLFYNVELAYAQSSEQRLRNAAEAMARKQYMLETNGTPPDDATWLDIWEVVFTPALRAKYLEMARAAREALLPS